MTVNGTDLVKFSFLADAKAAFIDLVLPLLMAQYSPITNASVASVDPLLLAVGNRNDIVGSFLSLHVPTTNEEIPDVVAAIEDVLSMSSFTASLQSTTGFEDLAFVRLVGTPAKFVGEHSVLSLFVLVLSDSHHSVFWSCWWWHRPYHLCCNRRWNWARLNCLAGGLFLQAVGALTSILY